ncbi:MAG TPA: response regulator [Verrucomicrobiae bacterium]
MKEERSNSLSQRNADWLEGRVSVASGPSVLIADDSESDIFFLLRAFSTSRVKNPVYVVRSGAEAIQYLAGEGKFANRSRFPLPKIVFLDLKMPPPDGLEVLKWKETRKDLPRMLWVAMSNFDVVKTINEAYAAGATTFLTKPLDGADVKNLIEAFDEYWTISETAENSEIIATTVTGNL